MNSKNFNIMSRYLEWKKDNFAKEGISILSVFAIFLSFILVVNNYPSIYIIGLATISFVIAFLIFVFNWDLYLESWYTTFNKKEIETIKFFKKNGFLK